MGEGSLIFTLYSQTLLQMRPSELRCMSLGDMWPRTSV